MRSSEMKRKPGSGDPGDFDSRSWTGPEPATRQPELDRGRARSAFCSAGGSAARWPQSVSSTVLWMGLFSIFGLTLLGPSGIDPWPLSPVWQDDARSRIGLASWAVPANSSGLRLLLLKPNASILALTLLAGGVGILTAWVCRLALARGFRAAEAGHDEAVFVTRSVDLLLPGTGFLFLTLSAREEGMSLATLLVLALLSVVTVRAMTAVAERRFAGFGTRSQTTSLWDLAALAAISAVLTIATVHALTI